MSEEGRQNAPVLEESSVLSDSPLQDIHHSRDRLGQAVQVPDKCVYIYIYVYVSVFIRNPYVIP